jgi:hypothetical protein
VRVSGGVFFRPLDPLVLWNSCLTPSSLLIHLAHPQGNPALTHLVIPELREALPYNSPYRFLT